MPLGYAYCRENYRSQGLVQEPSHTYPESQKVVLKVLASPADSFPWQPNTNSDFLLLPVNQLNCIIRGQIP